jgi:hypothetical protein
LINGQHAQPEDVRKRNGGECQAIFIIVNLIKTNVRIHFLSGKADLHSYPDFLLSLKKTSHSPIDEQDDYKVRVVTSMLWLVFQIHWPPEDKPAFNFKKILNRYRN